MRSTAGWLGRSCDGPYNHHNGAAEVLGEDNGRARCQIPDTTADKIAGERP
jgi:hypothetical protein